MDSEEQATPRKKMLWIGGAVVLGVLGIFGLLKVRKEVGGIRNMVSPKFWQERANGQDIFSVQNQFLKRGNRDIKAVSFTFDDGPHPESCRRLLDILKDEGVHATFFVVGKKIKEHPELIRRMLAEGHEVGNHTQDHLRLPKLPNNKIADQLDFCEKNFRKYTGGSKMNLFRPPGMEFNDTVLQLAAKRGYITVGWTVGAKDFDGNPAGKLTPEIIYERVMKQVDDGGIILLHDNPITISAMPRILQQLKKDGYKIETITEMLAGLKHPIVRPSNAFSVKPEQVAVMPGAPDPVAAPVKKPLSLKGAGDKPNNPEDAVGDTP